MPYLEAFTLRSQSPELLAEIRGRHALVVEAVRESNVAFAVVESEVRIATGRMAKVARNTDTILRDEIELDEPAKAIHDDKLASNEVEQKPKEEPAEATTQSEVERTAREHLSALHGLREDDNTIEVFIEMLLVNLKKSCIENYEYFYTIY